MNIDEEGGQYVALVSELIDLKTIRRAIAFRNEEGKPRGVPWVFLWPAATKVEGDPVFEDWTNVKELRAGLERVGVCLAYDAAVGALLTEGCDFKCHHSPDGQKALVVVIGIWRPSPLLKAFFGYSDDPKARCLELRAYLVTQKITRKILDDDARVEAIVADYPPEPDLLRWVSGVDRIPPLALLGVGALGSAIFNNLVRAGADDVLVQDADWLLPHNLARHTARTEDVFGAKVDHAKSLAAKVIVEGLDATVQAHREDITRLDVETLTVRTAARVIVDATADELVRVKLDALQPNTTAPILRTEIFDEGRLGVTFVSSKDGPSFSDLMVELIGLAPSEPAVAAWLDYEAQHPLGPDPMLYGFGCSSQTIHLPNYVVEQHASAAMPSILGDKSGSGIGLKPLDRNFRPLGWRWFPIKSFSVLQPRSGPDWSVRLSAGVVASLNQMREAAFPAETGGYLYGAWDPTTKTISVVYASALPPGSVASPTTLELGPAGQTVDEQRLERTTRGKAYLCGTWHSHPGGSAAMSGRDYNTLMAHHEKDEALLRPTLVVIVADGDIQPHMKL